MISRWVNQRIPGNQLIRDLGLKPRASSTAFLSEDYTEKIGIA